MKARTFVLLFFAAIGFHSVSEAQFVFQRTIDPDPAYTERVHSVVEANNGEFVLVGDMEDRGTLQGDDVFVIRTDAQGQILWGFVYEINNCDLDGEGVAEAMGNECVVTGTATENGENNVFAFRLSNTGALVWDMIYEPTISGWIPSAHNIKQEVVNGVERFLIVGGLEPPSSTWTWAPFIMQISATGAENWSRHWVNYYSLTRAIEVEPTSFGYYILTEDFVLGSGSHYFVVGLVTNPNPTWAWFRRVQWPDQSTATDLVVVDGDDAVVSGSVFNPATQDWDVGVIRLNWTAPNNMSLAWGYTDQQPGDQRAISAALNSNNQMGILIDHNNQAEILNIETAGGNLVWKEQYNGFILNAPRDIEATADGGYIAVGTDGNQATLLKVDPVGFSGCSQSPVAFNRVNETLIPLFTGVGIGDILDALPITMNPSDLEPEEEDICCSIAASCPPGPVRNSFNRQVTMNPDNQGAFALDILDNGDLVIVGTNEGGPSGSRDNLLVRTDGEGNLCSLVDVDHQIDEWYLSVYQRTAGCGEYFTTGFELNNQGDFDLFISRHDATGVPVWTTRLDNQERWEQGYDLAESQHIKSNGDVDNYISVCGFTQSWGSGSDDGLLVSTQDNGLMVASNAIGWGGLDRFYAMTKNSANPLTGNYVMVGETQGPDGVGDKDSWLVRTLVSAVPIASRVFGIEGGDDIAQDIVRAPDGSYYVVGQCRVNNPDPWDMYVARFDANFNMLYFHILPAPENDIAFGVDYNTSNDMLYIAGSTESFGMFGNKAAIVVEVFPLTGQVNRTTVFDDHEDESFQDVKVDANGRVVCVGNTSSFWPGDSEVYMVKLDNMMAPCGIAENLNADPYLDPINTDLPGRIPRLEAVSVDVEEHILPDEAFDVCPYMGPVPPKGGGNSNEEIFAKRAPATNAMQLAPNPAQDRVQLNYSFETEADRMWSLLDLQGRIIRTQAISGQNGSQNIELQDLPTGIYLVRISGGPEGQIVKRLAVQH